MGYDIGPRIGIDGEKEFRDALRQLNAEYKAMEAQIKALTAEYERNGDEQGKLTMLSEQYSKEIENQERRQEMLSKAIAESADKHGENHEITLKWQRTLYESQATVEGLRKKLDDTKSALQNVGAEMDDFADSEELQNALKQLNAEYKVLEAQTKALTAEYDRNGDKQGKLTALSAQYSKEIENQERQQKMLSEAVAESTDKHGKNHEITLKLQQAIYESQATVAGLRKKLDDTESALRDAGSQMDDFADSTDAAEGEMGDLADGMDDAGDAALDFGDVLKANLLSDVITAGVGKLKDVVKDFAGGMVDETAAMKAANSQFTQTFGPMEAQARGSLTAISNDLKIASERMQGSYTMIYAFAKTAGAESEQALDIASRSMRAAADNAAYYDRSIEDTTETLQSFLKGNYENDAALGISATETTRNTAANEKYAKSFKDLTEAQKVDVLLSMVEAGNKASGAMGQAAREADGWENVTGELESSWRKLQSRLGEPVLENTIPVMQKLTDKLNDAADSDAFEKLAKGFGKSLGWMIDNGPAVISAASGMTTAILSFRVATSAASWIDKLKTSTGGLWTVMSAHPMALLASAAAGLIAAVAMAPETLTEAQKEMEALVESAQNAADAIHDATDTLATSVGSIDVAAKKAEDYISRLENLESQGLNTAEAQAEYNSTIELLQTLIPDINIQLDEQTGLIKDGAASLRLQIDAWKDLAKAEVYAQQYKKAFEAVAEAESKLINAQAARDEIIASDAYLIWARRVQHLNRQFENGALTAQTYNVYINDANKAFAEYDTLNTYTAAIEQAQAEMAACKPALDDLEAGYLRHNKAAQKSAEANDGVGKSMDALQKEYEQTRTAAEQSITRQIGLFQDLSGTSQQTFDDMLAALATQQDAFFKYADNLQIAMDRGIDQGLIQKLSDGSVESMQILNTLVSGTDEQIALLNDSLGNVDDGRQRVDAAVLKLQENWNGTMLELRESATADGSYIVEGLAAGIEADRSKFTSAVAGLAWAGRSSFKEIWSINSPSAVAKDLAHWIPLGAAEGVDSEIPAFEAAMDRLYYASAFTIPDFHASTGYRGYQGSIPQSTRIDLGGVTINLTAPQGTDLQTLARMVGDTINDQAIRRAIARG